MSLQGARRPGSRPTRTPGLCGLATLFAVPLLGACGVILEAVDPEPEPERNFYAEGIYALEVEDFAGAEDRFRRVAARCESGAEGRSSLLALTTLHLDLRNPNGRPDEAARLAAIHLNLPHAPAAERSLSRALYLLSVYRGADPVEGPEDLAPGPGAPTDTADTTASAVAADTAESADTAEAKDSLHAAGTVAVEGLEAIDSLGEHHPSPHPERAAPLDSVTGAGSAGTPRRWASHLEPARRFEECDVDTVVWRGVPEYPGTPPSRWAQGDTVLIRDTGAAGRAAALQTRVNELEAELARIRKLLQGGGGGGVEVPKLRP